MTAPEDDAEDADDAANRLLLEMADRATREVLQEAWRVVSLFVQDCSKDYSNNGNDHCKHIA